MRLQESQKQFWKDADRIERHRDAESDWAAFGKIAAIGVVIFLILLWRNGPEFWKKKP